MELVQQVIQGQLTTQDQLIIQEVLLEVMPITQEDIIKGTTTRTIIMDTIMGIQLPRVEQLLHLQVFRVEQLEHLRIVFSQIIEDESKSLEINIKVC